MAKKEAARQSNLSQEIVHDSSDEEEQETPQPQPKKKTKTASQPNLASHSTTTTSNDDDDEDTEESSSSQSSAEEDGSDAESTSNSSSSSSRSKKRSSDTIPETPVKKARKTATSSNVRIAPKAYKPPTGYEALTLSASDYTSEVTGLLDNLDGKQVWHISVPDFVSIESVKSFDMQAVMRGESILSKDGVSYNLHSMPSAHGYETLLMPHGTKSTYKRAAIIERNFQLREMGDHAIDTSNQKSKASTNGETATKDQAPETGKPKAIRQQPQGLKMRYFPYGSSATRQESADEDVEMTNTFQVPDEIPEPTPKKKSKKSSKNESQRSMDGENGTNPEKKKKKKHKLVDADVL
ncbi:hypothetical protein LTS17_012144 [Exophiala oligosperma]